MNKKEWVKQFEGANGRKPTASELAEAQSTKKFARGARNIKIYIGIVLGILVAIILVSVFSHSLIGKKESNQASSAVSTTESTSQSSTSQGKTDETDKDKQEEIQKLKDQLTALDTKITEAEALGFVITYSGRAKGAMV